MWLDVASEIIQVIWPTTRDPQQADSGGAIAPLRLFVSTLLQKTHVSGTVLIAALIYLLRLRKAMIALSMRQQDPSSSSVPQGHAYQEDLYFTSASIGHMGIHPTPPISPRAKEAHLEPGRNLICELPSQRKINLNAPCCGRRLFLAAIMLASKYLIDRHHANAAWSTTLHIPLRDLNEFETLFLRLIDHDLFIKACDYRAIYGRIVRQGCQEYRRNPTVFSVAHEWRLRRMMARRRDCRTKVVASLVYPHVEPPRPARAQPPLPTRRSAPYHLLRGQPCRGPNRTGPPLARHVRLPPLRQHIRLGQYQRH